MILSRLQLDLRDREARHCLHDAQRMHQRLLSAFPSVTGPAAREHHGVLHRVDFDRDGRAVVLVQSRGMPDWSLLPSGMFAAKADAPNPAVRETASEARAIDSGSVLMFRLRANVTRKVETRSAPDGTRRNGRRVPHRTDEGRIAWLERKGSECGFALVEGISGGPQVRTLEEALVSGERRGATITFAGVLFEGLLRVTDAARFRAAWERGIGPAKAYGFGLLSVRPAAVSESFHLLPRVSDSWTFLYAEHVRVEQDDRAIQLLDASGRVPVPVSSLSTLMLGPGSTITHAAIVALADNGCTVLWCGEGAMRMYACGIGETNRAANLLAQAEAWGDATRRMEVVMRMYRTRFTEPLADGLTLQQVRGHEGIRVRDAYARLSAETGIAWSGRAYRRGEWGAADPVNRALSTANACLYGVVHGALVATGFCTGLGFVHTGRMLAFVYDIADLYKVETTIPAAFRETAADPGTGLESRVRKACRATFRSSRLLERIVPDVQRILGLRPDRVVALEHPEDDAAIAALWDPEQGEIAGGQNYGSEGNAVDEEAG